MENLPQKLTKTEEVTMHMESNLNWSDAMSIEEENFKMREQRMCKVLFLSNL